MKNSIFALPALLRPALFLAVASQTTFSVQDDLLAFPQYQIEFSDDYVLDDEAQSRLLRRQNYPDGDATVPSQIEHYRPNNAHLDADGGQRDDLEEQAEYEYMYLGGQPYICRIPQVVKPSNGDGASNDTLSKADEEKELTRATERGWELLSGMQGSCVYFISGWWSYKFCYNDGVRQFHQLPPSRGMPVYPPIEDPSVEGYTLGTYSKPNDLPDNSKGIATATKKTSPTSSPGELVQRGESRYLVQHLSGGTKCDLTGRDRRVEVQFHCNTHPPTDRISLIKETSTCAYLMVIQTPRLCNDVAFLPPQKDSPNSISCSPILSEGQVDDYKRDLATLKAAESESRIWKSPAHADAAKVFLGDAGDEYPLVGDTVVGGRNLVPPSVTLEKGAIVGGGKETYIETVASSDGKVLSKEEIQKLGLGSPKDVEKLRKQLEKIAQGQEWKLDVIDTPRGREYRGIIGDGKEDEGKEEKKKGNGGSKGKTEKENGGEEQEGSQEEYFVKDEL